VGSGQGAQISALSSLFNTTLFAGLDATGIQTMRVNAFALLNEVIANPTLYGFTNASTPACGATPSLVCTAANLVTPTAAQTFVFADTVHPTTGGHALIAQAVQSMITGPQQMASLVEAPLAVEQANFRALDNRMWSSLNAPRSQGKLEAWAAYDYSHGDLQAGPTNGSAHMNTVAVGGDMKVSDRMLVGAMFGYTDNKGDFGGPGGGYTLKQPVGTVYAGYGDGPWYVGATLGAGNLDYSDITRLIPLGAATRTESAEANGYEFTGRILGGYWFTMRDLMHGPYARLAWTHAVVKQFSEMSTDSTALTYGEQSRTQLLWSLGWQVTGNLGAIRPYARATWEIDSKDPASSIGVSSVSLAGHYSVPVAKPDNSYALFNLGASTELGSVTGFIAGSATAGRTDGNYWAITVGLRMPL
jgi:outer membrane lipase/esterase